MTPIIVRFAAAALAGTLACLYAGHAPARAAEPAGTWLTEDGRARVRTERCGMPADRLCGYVLWLQKPLDAAGKPRTDQFNPDARRQARLTLGHQMLLGLKLNAEGRYEGTIYNGDNGKSYDVTVWSDSPSELSVKGCMLAVFCGSQTWTRVSDVAPGQLQGATDLPGGPRSDPEWAARAPTGVPSARARDGSR